ncbi:TetR family transcriptional regulator [Gordonia spumicola]|uniref:TetR family transcriptional regulator n=1 Tax=Gordonia spumicola TaxID=589161 RepID=A0A7I9V6E7_9ACTN|nr:TetR/AcrR family transcriptional regulator [Gordonia spumicola]GEE00650.1 TetR family transcriptional regulator [Gordonia spumicola]
MTAEDRLVQRREALIAAGLELFGTQGYPNVSVKRICDLAGLTQRYFYESFPDRAALLGAVYTRCVDTAREATVTAAAAVFTEAGITGGAIPAELIPRLTTDALGAMIHCLSDDPRRARVMMIEVVGVCPDLEKLRLTAIHEWAALIVGLAVGDSEPTSHQRLASIGLVGALTQLLVDWQTAMSSPIGPDVGPELFDVEAIHAVVTDMFIATYDRVF